MLRLHYRRCQQGPPRRKLETRNGMPSVGNDWEQKRIWFGHSFHTVVIRPDLVLDGCTGAGYRPFQARPNRL